MKYRFKTKPYKHQVQALNKLFREGSARGGGLGMEMGTGKTKVAIDYANIQYLKGRIDRVLVLAPLSVVGVWELEINKHSPNEDIRWRVTNYDKLPRQHYFEQLATWCRDGDTLLVLDESHKIKNPTAKRSRATLSLSKLCKYVVWMSGTPVAKNPLDLFSPFRCIDEAILGGSYGIFKRTYGVWGGYGGYQLIKFMNLDQLMRRIEPHMFKVKKEDCLDLPRKTHTIVPVALAESRAVYDRLARESIVTFKELEVETPIVLTRLLRLSQLTGGHLVGDDGSRRVGSEKLTAYKELLEEMKEQDKQKVVVFCRFLNELSDIAKTSIELGYKVIPFHGKTPRTQRDRFIAKFEETNEPTVFVAQISTGSLGISLTAASDCVFYSHTYNYAEFAQACDRLHRIGQSRPVTYYHLIARDTVDEAVWMALRTKRRLAEIVMGNPSLLMES